MAHFAPPKVVPPFRFATVEEGVYRGAYPTLKNFPFLETRGLRTVISLIPEKPTSDLEDFCWLHDIKLVHHLVEKKKDDVPVRYLRAVHVPFCRVDSDCPSASIKSPRSCHWSSSWIRCRFMCTALMVLTSRASSLHACAACRSLAFLLMRKTF